MPTFRTQPIRRDPNFATVPEEQDPLEALSTFLGGAPASTGELSMNDQASPPPDERRNNANVGLLRKQLGMGADPLDAMQDSDPTDPLTQRRAHYASVGSEQELQTAADDQQAQQLAAEHAKHQHALEDFFLPQAEQQRAEVQRDKMEPIVTQGQTQRDVAHIQNEGKIIPAEIKARSASAGGFGGDTTNPAIDYWAQQAMRDSSLLSKIPMAQRPAVEARMASMGGTPSTPTNQEKQMSETANDVLDVLDRSGYEDQAKKLNDQGLFSPGIGTIRQWAAQHGMGTMLGLGPNTAGDIGQFETLHGLLISAIQRAHAGARGAGNSEMAARFEKLLADQGDLPTFLGSLKGMRGLLEQYASHTNPTRGFSGAGAGGGGDDLGAGWGGQ